MARTLGPAPAHRSSPSIPQRDVAALVVHHPGAEAAVGAAEGAVLWIDRGS